MKKFKLTKKLLYQVGLVVVLILLAFLMYVIGKQHNIYIDNKDANGYKALNYVEVSIDNNKAEELLKRDRIGVEVMNQSHKITVRVGDVETVIKFKIPLQMRSVLISIPTLLAGESQDKWMREFVMETVTYDPNEEVVLDDTAGLLGE